MVAPSERLAVSDGQVDLREFLPPEELEYLAGSLDARIYITISKAHLLLRVRVERKEKEQLEPLISFFPSDIKRHQPWMLEANGEDARFLLETFYPHVRLQKPIFGLAISYLDWQKSIQYGKASQQTRMKKRYFALMQKMKEAIYDYDIGPDPLSPIYLAGYIDQHRGSIDTTHDSGSLLVQMRAVNKSFVQHLYKEHGGHTFPKGDPKPSIWRAVGYAAEFFLNEVSPFARDRSEEFRDLVYVPRAPGIPRKRRE